MADTFASLKKLEFPHAPHVAVKQLESCLRGEGSGAGASIPGLGSSNEELMEKLVEEHVFYRKVGRGGQTRKLTAIQELKLLDALNGFFEEQDSESLRHLMFNTLFAQIPDRDRSDVLAKLVSMAIGVQNKNLLECAAVWMQRQGCSSDEVTHIAGTVVYDYCSLLPDEVSTLRCLPELSAHFTCNFITAVSALYSPYCFGGKSKKALQREVVELVADWLASDSHLCLISLDQSHSSYILPQRSSLWTSPTKPNMQTPVPGLVRWCTQAPIAQAVTNHQQHSNNHHHRNKTSRDFSTPEQSHKTEQLWSRLHLSLLRTIMDFPNLTGANQLELITLADMNRIVKDLVALIREAKNKGLAEDPCIQASVDRTVEVLQVSLATGAFRCSLADLQLICKMLPPNRLLQILENQHLSRLPPPMHHERK